MKYIFIIALFAIFTIDCFSQNLPGKYEFILSGNYNTQSRDEGISNYASEFKSKNSKLAFGINRVVNSWVLVGLGIEYLANDDKFDYKYYNVTNGFYVNNDPSVESKIWKPFINVKLIKNLGNKFVIGLNVMNAYGFMTEKKVLKTQLSIRYPTVPVLESELLISENSRYELEKNEQYYNFSLEPEISYAFSNSFGLRLQATLYQFDSLYKHQAFFNTKTNQVDWTLGIIYRLK